MVIVGAREYDERKELTFSFVLINGLGSLDCFQPSAGCPSSPTALHQALAKASASSGLAKQNTMKSLSSRRKQYASGVPDRTPAAQNITSLFARSRTFSAGKATWWASCAWDHRA